MKKIKDNWYWCVVLIYLLFVAAVYLVVGEKSYIAIHDNLDLFQAQYKMLQDTNGFFAHGVEVPFLGGISRDNLPSELALSSVLYLLFPAFTAYIMNYLVRIVIAVMGSYLLAKEALTGHRQYPYLAVLCGLAYGMLHLFPCYGISFASLPLCVYLVLKIDRAKGKKELIRWQVALFAYPFVSYFSYFGLFICGYLLLAAIGVSCRRKKIVPRLLCTPFVLGLGYVCFEYRLFGVMLFGKEDTIRSLMVGLDLSLPEVLSQALNAFWYGMMHVESLHHKWVAPLCVAFLAVQIIEAIRKKKLRSILRNGYVGVFMLMCVNALIYGLWEYKPMRELVGKICPPLTGWQYNRTLFFNPFLWYVALFMMLYGIVQWWHQPAWQEKLGKWNQGKAKGLVNNAADLFAVGVLLVAMAITLLSDVRYNDLMHTCYRTALSVVKGKESDAMNYEQFYNTAVFTEAKEKIGYQGEWSVAYGLHPAVLEYNEIATLDGYLGYYTTAYKASFRQIIAPALERVEAHRINFDKWGARAYLYPGTDMPVVTEYLTYGPLEDERLYIDVEAFRALEGTYIFSRVPIANQEELSLTLCYGKEAGSALDNGECTPYALYVYR